MPIRNERHIHMRFDGLVFRLVFFPSNFSSVLQSPGNHQAYKHRTAKHYQERYMISLEQRNGHIRGGAFASVCRDRGRNRRGDCQSYRIADHGHHFEDTTRQCLVSS